MGSKGGGDASTPELRALSGISQRFEREARPVREEALGQLLTILRGGLNYLGPSMGGAPVNTGTGPAPGPAEPRRFSRAELNDIYGLFDAEKSIDVNRITRGLGETFTLDELTGGANLSGLSARSIRAYQSVLGELESLSKSGGAGLGGVSGAGTGAGSALLPLAQGALEQSRASTARSLQALGESFAGSRIGGTPFAETALAKARVAGEEQTSQIPSRILEMFLTQTLPLAFGQSGPAVAGLSSAAQAGAQLEIVKQQQQQAGLNALANTFGQLGRTLGAAFR